MQGQEVRVAGGLGTQLAELVLMTICIYMASPGPKPPAKILPAVVEDETTQGKRSRQKSKLSPEVQKFKRLPLHIQRQVLGYAREWIDANYEREGAGEDKSRTDAVQGGRG